MKTIAAILFALTLTGCTTVIGWIPSFSDPNQSARIVDVRQSVEAIDCTQPQLPQALRVQQNVQWFMLYSESKGIRQQDVIRIVEPMQETVTDWVKRSTDKQGTVAYCEIKKKILQSQAKTAASAVLGRF